MDTQNIFEACKNGDFEKVKFLVEQGSDIEIRSNNGNTPLIWASYNGRIEIIKFLVEKGADLETKNIYGNTPLIEASLCGNLEIVKFLVEKGADIETEDNYGNKFIDHLSKEHKEEIENIIYDIQSRKAMVKPGKTW